LRILRSFSFQKVCELILTLFLVTIISFLLMKLSPVDSAEAYARRTFSVSSQEQVEKIREDMGLNKPLLVQYGTWLVNATHLDFGTSLFNGHKVLDEISNAMGITLKIVLLSAMIQAVGILILGCICYLCKNNFINILLTFLCIAGVSMPPFFFASTFIDVFAVNLNFISVTSNTGILRYLPAAICLSISGIAFYSQLLSKNIEHEMNEDYVLYARCRGLAELRILLYHALPHALTALIPSFLQMVGISLAGSAIIERIFSLPGLGYTIIDSILYRDAPMIHATILFLAFFLVICNTSADILQRVLKKDQESEEVRK